MSVRSTRIPRLVLPGQKYALRIVPLWVLLSLTAPMRYLPAQGPAPGDSLRAYLEAVTALRSFQYQHWAFVDTAVVGLSQPAGCDLHPPSRLASPNEDTSTGDCRIVAICEANIGDFCFGPTNGKLSVGGRGTFPILERWAPRNLPRVYRKTSSTLLNRYVARLAAT